MSIREERRTKSPCEPSWIIITRKRSCAIMGGSCSDKGSLYVGKGFMGTSTTKGNGTGYRPRIQQSGPKVIATIWRGNILEQG